jgi:hypothetical protein
LPNVHHDHNYNTYQYQGLDLSHHSLWDPILTPHIHWLDNIDWLKLPSIVRQSTRISTLFANSTTIRLPSTVRPFK